MKIARAAGAAALALSVTTSLAATSEAATPGQVTKGTGWTLGNPYQVTSIAPVTYTITFDSVAARTRLTPYMKQAAYETQRFTPGVRFVVSTTVRPMNKNGCQTSRTISVSLEYRPVGLKGVGWGGNCYVLADHSLHSGLLRIDTEWWYTNWFSANTVTNGQRIKNAVLHEFGHAIGLGHPNTDLDRDGVVESHECVKNTNGWRPVLCAPYGGNFNSDAGKWTVLERSGLYALVRNYQYR
jgi:hypothetical protein